MQLLASSGSLVVAGRPRSIMEWRDSLVALIPLSLLLARDAGGMNTRDRERGHGREERIQSILLDRVRVEWEVQVLRKEEVSVKFVKS